MRNHPCPSRRHAAPAWRLATVAAAARLALPSLGLGIGVLASAPAALAQSAPPPAAAASAAATLSEVTVKEQASRQPLPYAGGQAATGGRLGMLGNKDFMETPHATRAYTAPFIAEQPVADVQGVIARTDPAVFLSGIPGEHLESYAIRGFAADAGDVAIDGLAGMASSYRSMPEMFERIEVLKGPSAMLGGMLPKGSVGGSVNLVPKRAGSAPLTRLTLGAESDAHGRAHLDLGRRFGPDQAFGLRVNAMRRQGSTAIDTQKKKAHLASLALDWRGPRARVSADLYRTGDRVNGMTRGLTLAPGLPVPAPPKPTVSWNPPWAFYDATAQGAMLRGEFDLNAQLTAWAAAGTGRSGLDTLMGLPTVLNTAGDMRLTFGGVGETITRRAVEAGLKGTLRTGAVGHQFALNLTHFDERIDLDGFRLRDTWSTNVHHPVWGPALPRPLMALSQTKTRLRSLGLADTLSFLQGQVQLTLGLRRQQVVTEQFNAATGAALGKRYDASATTPAAALLVKASERVSVYANAMQGLSQGAIAPAAAANAGEVFAPYKSKQKEIGLKIDMDTFAHTVGVYEIRRPSRHVDPVSNVFSFGGEQRNRGVEWSFFGAARPGLRLMGGIAYSDAKVTKAARAAHEGKQAPGLPRWQGKLGAEWDVPALHGLTLTAHASHASRQYLGADNALSIPGRTVLDLGARYRAKLAGYPLTLRATVTNVANKVYWAKPHYTSLGLGAPRIFMLSASMDF